MGVAVAFVVSGAAVLAALGVWVKKLTPFWRRLKAVHDIIERELTPNGGGSMKDQSRVMSQKVSNIEHDLVEARAVQASTLSVLDTINIKNHAEHERMWAALTTLGFDRRRHEDPQT